MNLVTIIGTVKSYSNNNILVNVDDILFTVKSSDENQINNLSSGDIVGIIGKINKNNEIQAKHISIF